MEYVKKLTNEKISILLNAATSYGLKPNELLMYEKMLYIAMRHATSDVLGDMVLFSSSNRLKSNMSVSKATCNRYIKKLVDSKLINRIEGKYKEPSRFYFFDIQPSYASQKNDTLVSKFKKYSINPINEQEVRYSLVYDQYIFYKDYARKPYIKIKGITYSAEQVRELMSYLDEGLLSDYAKSLPDNTNKQYIVNGLFFLAVKEKRKKQKETTENTEPYTMEEVREDHGYDFVVNEMPSRKKLLDKIMDIIYTIRNTTSKSISLGKNKMVSVREFINRIDTILPETLSHIVEEYERAEVYCPDLYLKNLIFNIPEQEELMCQKEIEKGLYIDTEKVLFGELGLLY